MINKKYTYRLNTILIGIVVWEIVFWLGYYLILNLVEKSSGSSNDLLFKNPQTLNVLFLLIPIIGLFVFNISQNNKLAKTTNTRVLQSYLKPKSSIQRFLKYFLFRNAFVFLVIAMAQPVSGKKKVSGTSESLELVVCLDISNSMNTKDISKDISRLEISKRALIQLVNNLHGERIGICLFANSAFVQLPITNDYGAAKLFIRDIETSMNSNQGTNIDQALRTAFDMFSKEKIAKGIILVTDGENHEQNPSEILAKIKSKKIQLSVLGIGTRKGGLVPKNPNRPELGYKTTALGKAVLSKINEQFIKDIASKGGGYANVSSSVFPNLSALLTQINQMKRTKIDNLEFDIKEERYQIPLMLSIISWLAFILWSKNYIGFRKNLVNTK